MVVRKDIDQNSALLTVTVTRDELKPKLDAELKKLKQRMPVKGFRPGQVPMDYIKKMYGSSVFSETLNDTFSEKLVAYLRESGLNILGQPLPRADQQLNFSMSISNPDPEYSIDYEIGYVQPLSPNGIDKSTEYEWLTVSNLDELAEEDLKYARKRMGKSSQVDDQIQSDDMVTIDAHELESEKGGVKEGGLQTDIKFLVSQLKDESLIELLKTKKAGDEIRFNARSAEGSANEEMYRKYILNLQDDDTREVGDWFEGAVKSVERMTEAELNEEFFAGYFGPGVSTREEAIEKMKSGIRDFYDVRSNALLFRTVQERLLELNPIELPDTFLLRWLGVTNEGKLSAEQIEREYPAFAQNLRWTLIRDHLIDAFDVDVTDAELKQEYANRLRQYFQGNFPEHLLADSIARLMQDEKDVEKTRRDLESDKLLQALKSQITLAEKAVPSDEFHKIVEEVTAKAKAEQEQDVTMRTVLEEEGE